MEEPLDFKALQDKIQAALVATTRKVNLIATQDIAFRRSVDPEAGELLDEQREKLLSLASSLVNTAASLGGGKSSKPKRALELEDAEEVDDNWQAIVDSLDIALEKADTCIDEYTGLVKRKDAPTADMGPTAKKSKPGILDRSLRYANIIKPQKAFEVPPKNHDKGPWKPLLTKKPHAIVPLDKSLATFDNEDAETQYDYLLHLSLLVPPLSGEERANPAKRRVYNQKIRKLRYRGDTRGTNGVFRYKHPYETEILQSRHPESVYQKRDPIPYTPIAKSSPTYVDTYEGVLEMLEDLKQAKEIAVDLEHHDFRTYHGLLSLMQISTREKDWIVDTLKPWRQQLEILNEVFADPSIVKVFHGAFMDIVWLQRDLGLYVVGLFDTFHAAEALMYPSKSLAYLLKKFVDFEADKRYQTADWRIRPLPEEMLYYARSDTHYLLYVYDMMRNELLRQSVSGDPHRDLLERTLQRSKDTALQRYEAYTIDGETGRGSRGWFNLIHRLPNTFSREQFSVYRALHKWRDDVARREDESPMFLMSNQLLVDIARAMPETANDLRRLFTNVGPPVRNAVDELVDLIQDSRQKGATGPSLLEVIKADSANAAFSNMTLTDAYRSAKTTNAGQGDDDIPDAVEVAGSRSQLWGNLPMSTLWEKVSNKVASSAREDEDHIAVPWSSFVANAQVTEDDGTGALGQADVDEMDLDEDGGAPLKLEVETAPEAKDEQFTLRSGRSEGTGRTQQDNDSSDSSSDEDSEEKERLKAEKQQRKQERRALKQKLKEEKAAKKAEEKAARKAEKKALKAAAKAEEVEEDDGEESDDEQPFDYSKAQSVMRSKRDHGADKKGSGGAKVFDPYTSKTTAQGPKPARRMNFEKPGKTATFKK
ncbi:exosome complex exonuclease RRP6 [Pyricularia oryzae]|nr:exosome complex exonuclease RRP6 [Pyricularia oryzae]KAI7925138.1 exosome complex exonuclease RRP6 [Pyricularia oryzae]